MAVVHITSNSDQVVKRLSQRIKRLQKRGKDVTLEIAKWGAQHAFNIAPKDTGATARAIGWIKGKSTDATSTIYFGDGHPRRRGKIKGVGLTKYMNFDKSATTRWRGEPHYIDETSKEVRKRFSKGMRRVVSRF